MNLKNKILGSLAILLCLFSIHASAVVITTSGSSPVVVGDTLDIEVTISGLGNGVAPSLGAFDLDISYDAGLFSFNSYTLGVFLGDDDLFEAIDFNIGDSSPGGLIGLIEVSLLTTSELHVLQAHDSFLLATLNFEAIAMGTGDFTVDRTVLSDGSGFELSADDPINGFIEVNARPTGVPEPTTLVLLLVGLAGIGLKRKRFGR